MLAQLLQLCQGRSSAKQEALRILLLPEKAGPLEQKSNLVPACCSPAYMIIYLLHTSHACIHMHTLCYLCTLQPKHMP